MKRKNKKFQRKGSSSLNKLSLFQKSDGRFSKKCPLSVKNAPIIDYKNISLLKKYMSDNGKIVSSKISSVSFNKQRKLNREIKKLKNKRDALNKEILDDKSLIEKLNNIDSLEHYAREEYNLKKENEDIFIIEFQSENE